MKILKNIWWVVLLIIVFKVIYLFIGAANDDVSADMEPIFGMIFIFILISIVRIALWVIGRTTKKAKKMMSVRKELD